MRVQEGEKDFGFLTPDAMSQRISEDFLRNIWGRFNPEIVLVRTINTRNDGGAVLCDISLLFEPLWFQYPVGK